MKSSPSIWRYVVNVKSTVKILPIFVAFLENMNFKHILFWGKASKQKLEKYNEICLLEFAQWWSRIFWNHPWHNFSWKSWNAWWILSRYRLKDLFFYYFIKKFEWKAKLF